MRIHSDILTKSQLISALPEGCAIIVEEHGSRKRDHAFEVWMSAEPGTDAYGAKRRYAPSKAAYDHPKAATWQDWGDWIAELFAQDLGAIIGNYSGPGDFIDKVTAESERRAMYRGEHEAYTARGEWYRTIAAVTVGEVPV